MCAVKPSSFVFVSLLSFVAGCDDSGPSTENQREFITTVQLEFLPSDGTQALAFAWEDLDGAGGVEGTHDPIVLRLGMTYALSVAFLDRSFEPTIDMTEEIREEAEAHWGFIYGPSVSSEASLSDAPLLESHFADLESDYGANAVGEDLPVGLVHTVTTSAAGSGALSFTLRHVPELNGVTQKTADLPARWASGDTDLPGETDVDVTYVLHVEP